MTTIPIVIDSIASVGNYSIEFRHCQPNPIFAKLIERGFVFCPRNPAKAFSEDCLRNGPFCAPIVDLQEFTPAMADEFLDVFDKWRMRR